MVRGSLDLLHGAELYRRYNVWGNETENKKDDYLLSNDERLSNVIDYYSSEDLYCLKTIGEVSDYFTYKLGVKNTVIDENHLKFGCASIENIEEIEKLASRLCDLVSGLVNDVLYEINDENSIILEIL